jgi:hypothetical protein
LGSVHPCIRQESAPADESLVQQVPTVDVSAEIIDLPLVESHLERTLELLYDGLA